MESKETSKQKETYVVVANEILSSGRFQECSVEEALEQHAKPASASATNCNSTTNSHSISAKEANGGKKSHESLRSFWIDTEILGTPDLTCLPDNVLNVIPPFVKRHLMQASQLTTPQTLVLPESVLVVFPILSSATARLAEQCCAVICLENLLITIVAPTSSVDICSSSNDNDSISDDKPRPPTSIFQRLGGTSTLFYQYQLPRANTTAVLCALLGVQASRVSHVMEELRNKTVKQYEQMRQDADSINKSDIMDLVDQLLEIESVADEQNQVFTILHDDRDIAGTLDSKTLHPYSKALLATSSATKRSAAKLEKIQLHVNKMYDSRLQERANHRLNLLTVFSAVFLPISLLAGIWGMNFITMPETETENGYYFALGTMAAIALSLTFAFWHKGWFNMP